MFSNVFSGIYTELSTGNIVNVPLDMLEIKSFRETIDEDHLSALNHSMDKEGVLENILITADEKNEKFLILEGNYRVEALRLLGKEIIPAKLLKSPPLPFYSESQSAPYGSWRDGNCHSLSESH